MTPGEKVNKFVLYEKKAEVIKDRLHQPGIYAIVNIVNGNTYVGQSHDITNRHRGHFCDLRNGKHANTHLQNAFNCYGEKNFKFVVLELVESERLNEREQHWINCTKSAYNMIKDIEAGVNYFIEKRENPDGRYTKQGETFTRPQWHLKVYGGSR